MKKGYIVLLISIIIAIAVIGAVAIKKTPEKNLANNEKNVTNILKEEEEKKDMNYTEQEKAAIESLSNWLADPNELGKKPSKIECVGSFELDDLKYYIIKYKNNTEDKWLVGVAGGYEENSLEAQGHTFSDFKEYKEETAKEECVQMVNMIKEYWKSMAEEYLKDQQ